eukprot:Pgem_evm1s19712
MEVENTDLITNVVMAEENGQLTPVENDQAEIAIKTEKGTMSEEEETQEEETQEEETQEEETQEEETQEERKEEMEVETETETNESVEELTLEEKLRKLDDLDNMDDAFQAEEDEAVDMTEAIGNGIENTDQIEKMEIEEAEKTESEEQNENESENKTQEDSDVNENNEETEEDITWSHFWSREEIENLKNGFRKYGTKWSLVLNDSEFNFDE